MRALKTSLWFGILPVALSGCTATSTMAPSQASALTMPRSAPGEVRMGDTIATMADQYNRPHPGPPGTGASSWVAASPSPAYVDTSPPPPRAADPPPLAAVANRQPAVTPPAERAEVTMANGPAAPTPAPAARLQTAGLSAADMAKGRTLFGNNGCGGCHKLADAGGSGGIGPSFDGNAELTRELAISTIHEGRGAMPSFGGQIADADIRTLAAYIVQAKK
ncbi:MAG: cytochrome c [Croceibacterium sp.]